MDAMKRTNSLIAGYFVGYLSIAFESWVPGSERH